MSRYHGHAFEPGIIQAKSGADFSSPHAPGTTALLAKCDGCGQQFPDSYLKTVPVISRTPYTSAGKIQVLVKTTHTNLCRECRRKA